MANYFVTCEYVGLGRVCRQARGADDRHRASSGRDYFTEIEASGRDPIPGGCAGRVQSRGRLARRGDELFPGLLVLEAGELNVEALEKSWEHATFDRQRLDETKAGLPPSRVEDG